VKILVVGGTHGTGLETVKRGLERGHEVTALARRPERLALQHPALRMVAGDIRDERRVSEAMGGQDAVCVSIFVGPSARRITTFSDGIRSVVGAMSGQGVRRLVAVTGIGAGASRGHGGFLYDRLMRPFFLKSVYDDKDREEEIVRASALDWTIVRPAFLNNRTARRRYRVLTDLAGVTAGWISRADVADFLVGEMESPAHVREAVLLTD